MSLISRKGTPDNPCRQHGGASGCFTTGWQDSVELSHTVQSWIAKWPAYERAVRACFKRHARSIPRFLRSGHEHVTRDSMRSVEITTECSSGAPSWELNRPGRYFHEQCNLYTRITNI